MISTTLKTLILLFLICGVASPQPVPRERVRERIEIIRMWKLTEALNLSQEQSMRFFPLFNQWEGKSHQLDEERNGLLDELELVLAQERPKEKEIRTLLQRLEENQAKKVKEQRDFWLHASEILTVRQRAEYLIFQRDFERRIKEIIRDIRERRIERR